MKADLYVQGHFWATLDLPGDSLLALLAKGIITEAQQKTQQLKADLESIDDVYCSISLSLREPLRYHPADVDAP